MLALFLKKLDSMEKIVKLLSMFMLKMQTLQTLFMFEKTNLTWVLVTKV